MKKILKVRWITTLLLVVGVVVFFSFKSGDSRSFQIAKNLDIFNSIVKELDMFYVDTLDPNKTIREGIDAMLYSLDHPGGQAVKTPPFHGGNRGSNPLGVTQQNMLTN